MKQININIDDDLPPELIRNLPERAGIYLVGGAVRDAFIGLKYRELDILVTSLSVSELTSILRRFGKAEPVGKSFTVIKWFPRGRSGAIDVSIPAYRDFRPTARHSEEALDPSMTIEDDLGQRDFTANAIAIDLRTKALIDPYGGAGDIEAGILRAVAKNSLEADPLRCLRAAVICARCGFHPDEKTLELIEKTAPKIQTIAPERIAEELRKMLLLPKPSVALRLCRDWGLLKYFLPELAVCDGVTQEGGWHASDVFGHLLATVDSAPPKFPVRLAAMLHDIGKPARRKYLPDRDRAIFYGHQNLGERMTRKIMSRLLFSKDLTDRVAALVRFHMFTQAQTDKGIRRFVRKVGADLLEELFELRFADIEAQGTDRDKGPDEEFQRRINFVLSAKPPLSAKDLAIGGDEIMSLLGIEQGPLVGRILEGLLEFVIDDPSKNSPEELIAETRRLHAKLEPPK